MMFDSQIVYYSCYLTLLLIIPISFFIPVPVLLQMVLYTIPILYIGSHLSLNLDQIDKITGKKSQAEVMTKKDAMMFPVIGSIALLSL